MSTKLICPNCRVSLNQVSRNTAMKFGERADVYECSSCNNAYKRTSHGLITLSLINRTPTNEELEQSVDGLTLLND